MKTRCYRTGGLLGCLILSLGNLGLQAQEEGPAPPPPQHGTPPPGAPSPMRAERIRQRIRDLHAAGKHEEADRMVERMRQAHMKMAQRGMDDRMPRGKADTEENRKAHAEHSERKGPPPPMGSPPAMKIRNLRMAAGLLDAAGYRDHAGKARQEAERIEDEMRKMVEMKKREDEQRKADEGKRRDLEKRKAGEMKNRPDPDVGLREEVKKLRRELEELRGQLKKAKAESESRPDRGPRPDRESRPERGPREEDRPG